MFTASFLELLPVEIAGILLEFYGYIEPYSTVKGYVFTPFMLCRASGSPNYLGGYFRKTKQIQFALASMEEEANMFRAIKISKVKRQSGSGLNTGRSVALIGCGCEARYCF